MGGLCKKLRACLSAVTRMSERSDGAVEIASREYHAKPRHTSIFRPDAARGTCVALGLSNFWLVAVWLKRPGAISAYARPDVANQAAVAFAPRAEELLVWETRRAPALRVSLFFGVEG